MTKQRCFWFGLAVGFLIGFLYGWLSIWATYTALERASVRRDAELNQVKRIIFYREDILSQRKEIFDWNRWATKPMPEWVVSEEEESNGKNN